MASQELDHCGAADEFLMQGLQNGGPIENGQLEKKTDRPVIAQKTERRTVSRRHLMKTIALFIAFLALGMNAVLFPPTLLHIEILYGTDTKTIAFTFMVIGFGALIGSALCGVLFDRINNELLWIVSLSLSCLIGAVCPFAPTLLLFNVALGLQLIAMSNVDAGANSYCLELWAGHKLKHPIVQAKEFIWSLGASISPLIVKNFLVPLPVHTQQDDSTYTNNFTSSALVDVIYVNQNNFNIGELYSTQTNLSTNSTAENLPDVSEVRLAYLVLASTFVPPLLIFTVLYLTSSDERTFWKKGAKSLVVADDCPIKNEAKDELKAIHKKRTTIRLIMFMLLFVYNFFYAWIELILSGLLVAFVVKGFGWQVNTGVLTVTLLFASLTFSRFLAIPISAFVSSRTLLLVNLSMTTTAFSLMALSPFLHEALLWFSVALAGLGMGTLFAGCLLWASTIIKFDGLAAGIYLIGSAAGSMTGPPLAGYLLGTGHHMMMAYLCLVACACEIIVISCMQLCANYANTTNNELVGLREEIAISNADKTLEERNPLTSSKT